MTKEKFNFKSIQDAESVKRYLESLINAIENKKIKLSSESQEVELNLADLFRFSIRVKKRERENKITIKIAWDDEKETEKETILQESSIQIST